MAQVQLTIADEAHGSATYAAWVAAVVETLARANVYHCRADMLPALYSSGVTYHDDGGQDWRDAPTILATGGRAACAELAAWRIAELRCGGVPASPLVVEQAKGLFHVLVKTDQTTEDPSRILGMT